MRYIKLWFDCMDCLDDLNPEEFQVIVKGCRTYTESGVEPVFPDHLDVRCLKKVWFVLKKSMDSNMRQEERNRLNGAKHVRAARKDDAAVHAGDASPAEQVAVANGPGHAIHADADKKSSPTHPVREQKADDAVLRQLIVHTVNEADPPREESLLSMIRPEGGKEQPQSAAIAGNEQPEELLPSTCVSAEPPEELLPSTCVSAEQPEDTSPSSVVLPDCSLIPEEIRDGFIRFWEQYPKKINPEETKEMWRRIHPDETLLQKMLARLERDKKHALWVNCDGKYIPSPDIWLEDYDRRFILCIYENPDYDVYPSSLLNPFPGQFIPPSPEAGEAQAPYLHQAAVEAQPTCLHQAAGEAQAPYLHQATGEAQPTCLHQAAVEARPTCLRQAAVEAQPPQRYLSAGGV